jgi:hypothetical protein
VIYYNLGRVSTAFVDLRPSSILSASRWLAYIVAS